MRTITSFFAFLIAGSVAIGIAMLAYGMIWRQRVTEEAIRMEALAMAEQRIARAQLWTETLEYLYSFVWIGAAVLVIFVAFFLAVVLHAHYERSRLRRYTPTSNGLYPLQQIAGQLVNPNLMIYPALSDNTPAHVSPQLALASSASSDRVAAIGNLSDMRMTAAGAKLLAGRYDQPVRTELADTRSAAQAPTNVAESVVHLSFSDAWNKSSNGQWLLGQAADGAEYYLSLPAVTHAAILGATGTGKTSSTALLVAMHAARRGWDVRILDGKGGIDWSPYANVFDVRVADHLSLPGEVEEIEAEHSTRMLQLQQHRTADFAPILFVVEEFGYMCQALRMADSAAHERMVGALSNLMRVSRSTRIHVLLIDQSPQFWPGVIKANIGAWIVYRLGGQQANAVSIYNADRLPAYGAFTTNDGTGSIYNAWHTAAVAQPQLRQLPVRNERSQPFISPVHSRSLDRTPTPTNATNATNGDDTSRWQPLIDAWFAAHPEALTGPAIGISDIARQMASEDGRPTDWQNYKSLAHQMYHEFRHTIRINGAPMGVDRSVAV